MKYYTAGREIRFFFADPANIYVAAGAKLETLKLETYTLNWKVLKRFEGVSFLMND